MSGNVRYFRGRDCPSIYRTYRTLPYTDPPQQEGLSLFAAAGFIADAVLLKQYIMLHIQPPHDPVGRKVPVLQLLCQLCGCPAPFGMLLCDQSTDGLQQRIGRLLVRCGFPFDQLPAQTGGIKAQMQPHILLVAACHVQYGICTGAFAFVEDQRTIRRTHQTVGAGDGMEYVLRTLLAGYNVPGPV